MVSEIAIRESFARAKRDIGSNSERIEELERENVELRSIINKMNQAEDSAEKEPEAESINFKDGNIKDAIREALASMDIVSEKARDDIARFNLTKKDIIKAKILEAVETQNLMLPKLKEIIVDNNKYCSKASFYRYFEELKAEDKVAIIHINNKSIARSNRIEVMPTA